MQVVLDKEPKTIEQWNKGNIKMLLAHPASAGMALIFNMVEVLLYGSALIGHLSYTNSLTDDYTDKGKPSQCELCIL